MDDFDFDGVYQQLIKVPLLKSAKSPIAGRITQQQAEKLLQSGMNLLPHPFQEGYAGPLERNVASVFQRVTDGRGRMDTFTLETLLGAVYQHANSRSLPDLRRFLAVISNMYRSFLDSAKRSRLDVPLTATLPPLAMFQSGADAGPFTITNETIQAWTGGSVGVVSLPNTFAHHPFLYGSLAHETGGHDVIHADTGLLQELRANVRDLFDGPHARGLTLLWQYWMDEAAADIYGVLNIGPTFGLNLAALLAVFIAEAQGKDGKGPPSLRTDSGPDERGALDPHPTDILRLSLVQGAVEVLRDLSTSSRADYSAALAKVGRALGAETHNVNLRGFARVPSGDSLSFDGAMPLSVLQESARSVGAMIATARLSALDGASVQDIETWDDADENTAQAMAGRFATGVSVVGLGDDAHIIAATTLAIFRAPQAYQSASALANEALDDSFATDPYWGVGRRDFLFIAASRQGHIPEVEVDPYAAAIIDYNPLDDDVQAAGLATATLTRHAIAPIPWPQGGAPAVDSQFAFNGASAELPAADAVIFTWTSAEANAMAAVLTPGMWAMPPSGWVGPSWFEYTNQWSSKFAGRSTGRGPASMQHYIGKYVPILIAGRRVLLFKSNFHLARDDLSTPVKDMFKQVLEQTGASLAITTGTAGAIGPQLQLGDVVVTNEALFKLDGTFKNAPFNRTTMKGPYVPPLSKSLKLVNSTLNAANASELRKASIPPTRKKPEVFLPSTITSVGEPAVIVTTDRFEYDDAKNTFGLQGLGAMVEMDDAILGLACDELNRDVAWLAIRNASDPQMPKGATKSQSADIYAKYGYWTSIPSVLASWAVVRDFP